MKKDVKNRLRTWLLQGKSITSNQALRKWRTSRIAIYVCRLRAEGMKGIKTEIIRDKKTNDIYAKYSHQI